jgi:acetoin utilization deacetylase AcuC-like enzyme
MNKTAVVFSPAYYRHNPGKGHPESKQRLQAIIRELEDSKPENRGWRFVLPEKASTEALEQVHNIEYIRLVEAICKAGGGLLDLQDTATSPESFEVALYAVGGAMKAVDLVMKGEFENAFALVRPPGHHAARFRALGFCLFNNVAISAQRLLSRFRLRRVLILDLDAHHGNGTQEIFYQTGKVLYVSLHEDPRDFPGTGYVDETGEGEGLGHSVNVPLPYRTGDQVYLKAMNEIAVPLIRQYKPQFMLVSAGFDGHYSDPVGNLSLSASCIQEVYEVVVGLASELCHGRLVLILEGGYNPKVLGKLATSAVAEMSGTRYVVRDKILRPSRDVQAQGVTIIEEVKKVQKSFWSIA